jgi:hypothetical protein
MKKLDLPMAVARAFYKDLRKYHVEPDEMRRAEIAQRQLDALQGFLGPQDKKLRVRDVVKLFEEMRGLPL